MCAHSDFLEMHMRHYIAQLALCRRARVRLSAQAVAHVVNSLSLFSRIKTQDHGHVCGRLEAKDASIDFHCLGADLEESAHPTWAHHIWVLLDRRRVRWMCDGRPVCTSFPASPECRAYTAANETRPVAYELSGCPDGATVRTGLECLFALCFAART